MPRITPNLWFDTNALEAAEFYVSVFPNSEVTDITYYPDDAPNPVYGENASVEPTNCTLTLPSFFASAFAPLFMVR